MDKTRYLFNNLELNNPPLLKAVTKKGTRRLTFSTVAQNDADPSNDVFSTNIIKQLNFDFDTNPEGEYEHHTSLYVDNTGSLKQTLDETYKEELTCIFIPADRNDSNAINAFAALVRKGKKQIVIDALNKFDSNIEGVEILPDGLYLKMREMRELLPVSMAGDGVRRLINILSTIACEDYNIIIIDEIDTGLHYSAHKLMWVVLLDYIKERDIQLFTTTHNLECIQSLSTTINKDETLSSLVGVFNITKTKKEGYQAYRYSSSELSEAIKNQIEIR